jgi:REP element-mobilizing transposase RayT
MAHTHLNLLVHVVFSTKNRRDTLSDDLRPKLWKYISGIGTNHDITVLSVGGTTNHVHALLALPPEVPIAKAVQIIKANSSRWIGEQGIQFAWQEGYGAFSVSASNVGTVKDYIEHQSEHHAKRSFEDEFVAMLKKSSVEYDPQYVFG